MNSRERHGWRYTDKMSVFVAGKGRVVCVVSHIVYLAHDKKWKNVTVSYLYRNCDDIHTTTVDAYYMTNSHVIVFKTVRSGGIVVPMIVL